MTLKIILYITILLIVLFGLYILFYEKKFLSSEDIKYIRKTWHEIKILIDKHPDQAIIKADKLLDHTLKILGYEGCTGDKIKSAQTLFTDENGLWSAHTLCNKIIRDIDMKVSITNAKGALRSFEKAFYDLGIQL